MADVGLSLGIPNTTPVDQTGQRRHSNQQKKKQKKNKKEMDNTENHGSDSGDLVVISEGQLADDKKENENKKPKPLGKGDLIDIVV
ncbi:MAG: hypothetical protein ACE5HI_00800 [bacterium]